MKINSAVRIVAEPHLMAEYPAGVMDFLKVAIALMLGVEAVHAQTCLGYTESARRGRADVLISASSLTEARRAPSYWGDVRPDTMWSIALLGRPTRRMFGSIGVQVPNRWLLSAPAAATSGLAGLRFGILDEFEICPLVAVSSFPDSLNVGRASVGLGMGYARGSTAIFARGNLSVIRYQPKAWPDSSPRWSPPAGSPASLLTFGWSATAGVSLWSGSAGPAQADLISSVSWTNEKTGLGTLSYRSVEIALRIGLNDAGYARKPTGATSRVPRLPAQLVLDSARFSTAATDSRLGAGEQAVLAFRVRNVGSGMAQAVVVSGRATDQIEVSGVTLGDLAPGISREVSLKVTGRNALPDSTAELRVDVKDENGFDAPPLIVRVGTRAFRPPKLTVTDVGVSDAQGRSRILAGQVMNVTIRVKNIGLGRANKVSAVITSGPNVFLAEADDSKRTQVDVGALGSGEYRDLHVAAFANTKQSAVFPLAIALSEESGRYGLPSQDLGLRLEALQRAATELDVAPNDQIASTTRVAPVLTSDIDRGLPLASKANANAVAVIIGNRNYRNAPAVAFAANDAALMERFVEQSLGFLPGNVLYVEDASLSDLKAIFGEHGNPNGRLWDLVKSGKSDVFVFYSGHGAPEAKNQTAYLLPVDADIDRLSLTGYSLETLYDNLAGLRARSMTIVLDACFSGQAGNGDVLVASASPMGIRVTNPAAKLGPQSVVVAAATGQQIASWYPEQRHGLLTYFFMKGVRGAADTNRDRRITAGELRSYLSDPTEGVPYVARRLFGRDQTPQVFGENLVILH